MNVYLNEIGGLWAAIDSMYFSKRSWTREMEQELIKLYFKHYDEMGKRMVAYDLFDEKMAEVMDKLFKWSKSHITLGRFLDFTFTVEGLHRGAQDDFDSHAKRLENRIIRSSTRLSAAGNEGKSDWYKGKIITTDEALDILKKHVPESIKVNGKQYVRCINGYILEELKDEQDVRRGLYMLSLPSNFIFKCSCTEFAHIVNERDFCSHAHPELQMMIEKCKELIREQIPHLTTEWYRSVKN